MDKEELFRLVSVFYTRVGQLKLHVSRDKPDFVMIGERVCELSIIFEQIKQGLTK